MDFIDWSQVNWMTVIIYSALVFIAALVGNFFNILFNGNPITGAIIAAILFGIAVVDAVNAGAFEQRVAVHLGSAQSSAGVGSEERVAGASGEDHDPTLFKVALRAAADVGLANRTHRDGRLHPRLHTELLERVLHRERVHHGRQHAHVVAGRAVEPPGCARNAAENIATTDHHSHFNT